MRFFGLLATGALLGVGAAAALTIIPDRDSPEVALPEAVPAATPEPAEKTKKKADKPKYTAVQRRDRTGAVATLRDQGYRPVALGDYDPRHVLRVLVGKGDSGQRAFFFVGGRYLGNDTTDDSEDVRVVRAGNRSIALAYKLFEPDDRPCCPTGGTARVLFRWDGKDLAPQTSIPPSSERRAPG